MIYIAQKMMYCGLNSMTNLILTPMKKVTRYMMTDEQIQQMFSEESDDDDYDGFESILLILLHLIHGSASRGVYWS